MKNKKYNMLTRQGFHVARDDETRAKRELRIARIDRSGIGSQYPQYVDAYWTGPAGRVMAPKYYSPATGVVPSDYGSVTLAHLTFSGRLREDLDQPRAIAAVTKSLQTRGGAVLSLGTGQGKTTCACYIAAFLGVKTVVLVHKDVLRAQWAERVAQFLPGARVSFVQGAQCDTSGDVVIAMLQTLVAPGRTFTWPGVGFVVVDECLPYTQRVLTETGHEEIGTIFEMWKSGRVVNVQSFDEKTQSFVMKPVTHAWKKSATELVKVSLGKSNYRATPNHPVLTVDGWKQTGDIVPGAILISRHGTLRVSSTEREFPEDTRVYDLEVDGTHTFVCSSGPVVHNCHHIAAETFSTAMRGLCAPYTLGLSATPQRKDGLTQIVHWFLGPLAYAAQRDEMRHVTVSMIRYDTPRYRLPAPVTKFGTVNFVQVISDIAEDDVRTGVIVDAVRDIRAEDPRRVILILSHRRDHCIALSRRIPGAVAFLGGPKSKAAKSSKEHETAPVVCATYALASEGYDDSRLNTLVLATPCSDVTQAAGRILRGASGNCAPLIVDVMDDFGVAYAQGAKRRAFYKKSGFLSRERVQVYPKCLVIDTA